MHGLPWQNWPSQFRHPSSAVEAIDANLRDRIAFHCYLQFLADRDLRTARGAAAAAMDIGIVRDLAMGISPDGADAWMQQDVYVPGLRCGAPPDDFQPKGQEWGILPLNPLGLRNDLFPFVELVHANMRHAGGLRIDHIIGLQRQFLIPLGSDARAGCYVRFPLDDLLGVLALESHRNRCLVIGEDLGTVPEGFRERIHAMDVFGCAVLYFERGPDGSFKAPQDYRTKTVATVSTHDLVPLGGYWEKRDIALRRSLGIYSEDEARNAERERDHDRVRLLQALSKGEVNIAAHSGQLPDAVELTRAAHAFLASSAAQLFLAKLDELLGEREQLNVPGTVSEAPNWRRKLPARIDDPLLLERINELARLCAAYGRG
jgi:4-alpha-glucanotransferase